MFQLKAQGEGCSAELGKWFAAIKEWQPRATCRRERQSSLAAIISQAPATRQGMPVPSGMP